jgi:hypothetical protein
VCFIASNICRETITGAPCIVKSIEVRAAWGMGERNPQSKIRNPIANPPSEINSAIPNRQSPIVTARL